MAVSCPPRKREITASIVRNMDKCIFCRRCESVCNDVQTVGALGAIRRGFNTTLALRFNIREMPFNGGELSPPQTGNYRFYRP